MTLLLAERTSPGVEWRLWDHDEDDAVEFWTTDDGRLAIGKVVEWVAGEVESDPVVLRRALRWAITRWLDYADEGALVRDLHVRDLTTDALAEAGLRHLLVVGEVLPIRG